MSKILYRRWPKPGERVAIPGVGERARTITGTVERVSKRNCGPGVALISLREYKGEYLAEMGYIWMEHGAIPETPPIQIDAAMCGPEFRGDVRAVAQYLTDHGYPAVAITDSHNGAVNETPADQTVPEDVWAAALEAGQCAG